MGDSYPLDLLSPVRHVATELDRAAPAARSVSDLAAGYRHPNTGDLARVRREQDLPSNTQAESWLIGRAVTELGGQVTSDDGGYTLTRPFDKLRYPGRRKLHREHDPYAQLRNPFDRMTGRFSDDVRRNTGKDSKDELRESMREFGWIPELPAIRDERGVTLVGHRRLKVAEELGIDPVWAPTLRLGDGDEADARRFALAVASNLGSKPFTPEERKDLAEYLYGEREWSMQRIADALKVAVDTVSRDLRVSDIGKSTKRGRPRNLTAEQQQHVIADYHEFGGDKTEREISRNLGFTSTSGSKTVAKVIGEERGRREEHTRRGTGRCTCPNCGDTHEPTAGREVTGSVG